MSEGNYTEHDTIPPHVRHQAQDGVAIPPEVKWSGRGEVPPIGARIRIRINNIGPGTVVGYATHHGWLGVRAMPHNPPEWYVRQNGRDHAALTYGAELDYPTEES